MPKQQVLLPKSKCSCAKKQVLMPKSNYDISSNNELAQQMGDLAQYSIGRMADLAQ